MTMPALEIEHAYRRCEEITREEAANFFYGIRLLPKSKRQAMSAVYAFARRSTTSATATSTPRPSSPRSTPSAACSPTSPPGGPDSAEDAVAVGLAHAYRHYELPLDALEHLVDGVQADVLGTTYETVRRAARLLPARGRLDRTPVPGDLHRSDRPRLATAHRSWPTTSGSRCS